MHYHLVVLVLLPLVMFQLRPVQDGWIFQVMDNSKYSILAPKFWQEGNHTKEDILNAGISLVGFTASLFNDLIISTQNEKKGLLGLKL